MDEMIELGGQKKYHRYSEKKVGDVLVEKAEFIGSVMGTYGVQWEFRNDDGTVTVLNSAGQLDRTMETHAREGDVMTITYEGKKEIEKGPLKGKSAHQFKVLRASTPAAPKPESKEISLDDLE